MSEVTVIAEITNGKLNPATAELVTAASALGGDVVVVVPCTDASVADAANHFANNGAAKSPGYLEPVSQHASRSPGLQRHQKQRSVLPAANAANGATAGRAASPGSASPSGDDAATRPNPGADADRANESSEQNAERDDEAPAGRPEIPG